MCATNKLRKCNMRKLNVRNCDVRKFICAEKVTTNTTISKITTYSTCTRTVDYKWKHSVKCAQNGLCLYEVCSYVLLVYSYLSMFLLE